MSLRDELEQDPLSIGYAAMTNAEVEASLNAKTRIKYVSKMIGVGTILAQLQGQGGVFLDTLRTIGETNRDIHWLLEANIVRGEFDVGDPASRYGMEQLAAQLPAFADGINRLLALSEQPCSRAEELGIVVNDFEVRQARA